MNNGYDRTLKYINVLNRIQKKLSTYEDLLIIKNLYLTNNIFYYLLCILFRSIHLISFCLDFGNITINNKKYIGQNLKNFTCFGFFQQFKISYRNYMIIFLLLLIIFILKIIIIEYSLFKIKKFKNTNKWNIPNKFQIIFEHIHFLFFPFIIEYLSFIYYMCFFPSKFIIFSENKFTTEKIFALILSTIIIVFYNLENYFNIICSNKVYTASIYEINSYLKEEKRNNNRPVQYKYSFIDIFIFVFLQNLVIVIPLERYLKKRNKMIIKIIVSIIILLIVFILFFSKKKEYNYSNFINSFINIILLFCFFSIVFDLIIFFSQYKLSNRLNEIIYILITLIFSYVIYLLYETQKKIYFKTKISELLFQEKNNINKKCFINSFYYLHEIMLKIKEQKKVETSFLKYLNIHIDNCNKIECNCKLIQIFLKYDGNEDLKDYNLKLLVILNYLFESCFIDYDFYKSYDLIILLAEHFCLLKKNPIIAFCLISNYITREINNLNILQTIFLYELSQKYIYYISSFEFNEIQIGIKNNNNKQILIKQRKDELLYYFYILKKSNKIKKYINIYINNELKILKYKNIFENSIIFKYDESLGKLLSVEVYFFEGKGIAKDFYSKNYIKNNKKKFKHSEKDDNLNIILYLLEEEFLYYEKIKDSINQINIIKYIPIFMVFKYYLFFDFFFGGKMPLDLGKKLHNYLIKNVSIYNGEIEAYEYIILKKRYKEENKKLNSCFYSMFELKGEIRTKYFSENAALKLGFSQNCLIKEKMDILMPKEFFKSHENTLKQTIINKQKTYLCKQSYFFDKSNTVIYPSTFEITLVHNLSKNLLIILKSEFIFDNKYSFMLSNNFDLYANSINFEDEYYLNINIFKLYNINLIDILEIGKQKINKTFEMEFRKIRYQKFLRQIKIEEYFIPQLFSPINYNSSGIINKAFFNESKNQLLSKFINLSEGMLTEKNDDNPDEDDEYKTFIKKDNFENLISDSFINSREFIFHRTYNKKLNKRIFIKNLSKELHKIQESNLINDKDNKDYNLIFFAKKLLSNLLTKDEFENDFLKISIQFIFLYDRFFYFITIDDEKKSYLNIFKNVHFNNDIPMETTFIDSRNPTIIGNKSIIPFNKADIKSRNSFIHKERDSSKITIFETKLEMNNENIYNSNINSTKNENNTILSLEKIDNVRIKINKDRFISIIKITLVINIICLIIIYIIIIIFQIFLTTVSEEILFAYNYNAHQRDEMLYIYSRLLLIYYDFCGLTQNLNTTKEEYINSLSDLSVSFKENHYNFWDYFFLYNNEIGDDYNVGLLYKVRNYKKVINYWKNVDYTIEFASEMDVLFTKILLIEISERNSTEMIQDLNNFLFFKLEGKKVYLSYIKLLYYFCVNYEFYYKQYFLEFEETIYGSYKDYIKNKLNYYILLEILGLILYIIFYVSINIYLYYSNEIIIKNIIFLFLDLSEDGTNYKIPSNLHKISSKLIELGKIIADFDLNILEKYSKALNDINNNNFEFTKNDIYTNNDIKNDINNNEKKEEKTNKDIGFNISSKKTKINLNGKNSDNSVANEKENILLKSTFLKENNNSKNELNHMSFNSSKNILVNPINLKSNYSNKIINNNINKEFASKKCENENSVNIFDLLLNKSNKTFILIIKMYFMIMIVFALVIIVFSIYKIEYTLDFNNKFKHFYNKFTLITNRYSNLFYYFNILRTLLIFPEEERKKSFEKIMIEMDDNFERTNNDFFNFVSNNDKTYQEIIHFLKLLLSSKNNMSEEIKDELCEEESNCIKYIDSEFNLFDSGIDFAYRECLTNIKNIFIDYQHLNNKTDINEIKSILIDSKESEFSKISLSLSEVFKNVQERLYECFDIDITNMGESYNKIMTLINIITIIFSFLIFLFISIVMFYTIRKYTESIKESTYRINCSFYYIKNYKINIS